MTHGFTHRLYNELKVNTHSNNNSNFHFNLYQHDKTNLKVMFINTPGPATISTILVPTLCDDNKGLPHTLEHLIFCGSKNYPKRGYLEALALRCLSTGTNAWTASDHTAYTFNTVGYEGLVKVLPVFLDHVINPNLKYEDFVTEVYHIDGNAKQQGVVFSEMVSRENTEEDLLDINLRRELYPEYNTYSYECGGLTRDIAQLDNNSIKDYHQKFYHSNNITILLSGQDIPNDLILETLNNSRTLKEWIPKEYKLDNIKFPIKQDKRDTKVIYFPSDDTEVGSIGYAWRGPNFRDFEIHTSLELLLYYLTDSPASPLQQEFVTLSEPLSNDIGYELRLTPETSLWLTFYGVPNQIDLVAPGVYKEKVIACIKQSIEDLTLDNLKDVIKRFKNIRIRSLEEDASEDLTDNIIPAIVANSFYNIPFETSLNQFCNTFDVFDKLLNQDLSYWKNLATEWFINQLPCEVIALPSDTLGQKIEADRLKQQNDLSLSLGKDKLNEIQQQLTNIISNNKIDLIGEDLSFSPDMAKVPMPRNKTNNMGIDCELKLFGNIQTMQVDTQYMHLFIGLPVRKVPEELKPYFVLLQALIFQLDVINENDNEKLMPYKEAIEYTNRVTVERYTSLGLGNKMFSTSWLSNYFFISGKCEIDQFDNMLDWVLKSLFNCQFNKERVLSTAKNLLSGIEEILRDGDSMIHYLSSRIIKEDQQGDSTFDTAINLFRQEEFLADLISSLSDPNSGDIYTKEVLKKFTKLRDIILLSSVDGGAIQIGYPFEHFEDSMIPIHKFKILFEKYYLQLAAKVTDSTSSYPEDSQGKNNESDFNGDLEHDEIKIENGLENNSSKFIISRYPYQHPKSPPYPTASLICLGSLTSSYSVAIIPCPLFTIPASKKELENFHEMISVSVLCELFSRSNGYLFELVRGQGLAYHVQLYLRPYTGGLVLELSDSTNPSRALKAIWEFFEKIVEEEEWHKVIDDMELELAKSSMIYNSFNMLDSPSSTLDSAFRLGLCGFKTIDEFIQYKRKHLNQITLEDLRKVFLDYFIRFLDPLQTQIIVLSPDPKQSIEESDFETDTDGMESDTCSSVTSGSVKSGRHVAELSHDSLITELCNNNLGFKFVEVGLDRF